jgi:hypothetical protein
MAGAGNQAGVGIAIPGKCQGPGGASPTNGGKRSMKPPDGIAQRGRRRAGPPFGDVGGVRSPCSQWRRIGRLVAGLGVLEPTSASAGARRPRTGVTGGLAQARSRWWLA